MTPNQEPFLTKLGFRFGTNGPHAARTMMLEDLTVLFQHLPEHATRTEYANAIVHHNILGKPTKKSRELSFKHLTTLYALDSQLAVFRALRRLWALDASAQPMLALMAALARDPLLRGTKNFILQKQPGSTVARTELETLLSNTFPDRFSSASLKSFSQNVNGTWKSAGFLAGHTRKTRTTPTVTPVNVAFSLFLGYLEGQTGQLLFSSHWMQLLEKTSTDLEALTNSASHRGLLVFMNSGGIKELRFPGYLNSQEDHWRQEIINVN